MDRFEKWDRGREAEILSLNVVFPVEEIARYRGDDIASFRFWFYANIFRGSNLMRMP